MLSKAAVLTFALLTLLFMGEHSQSQQSPPGERARVAQKVPPGMPNPDNPAGPQRLPDSATHSPALHYRPSQCQTLQRERSVYEKAPLSDRTRESAGVRSRIDEIVREERRLECR